MVRTPSTMLPLGTEAEDFSLTNIDGRTLSFADVSGKSGTVLMFICNHCPFVKHVADELACIGHEYMPKGIGMVAINSNDVTAHPADSPEQMVHESEQRGYPFPTFIRSLWYLICLKKNCHTKSNGCLKNP